MTIKTACTVYFKDSDGKKAIIKYADVHGIKAGTAREILGEEDARGNGVPLNAPLIQILLPSNETATFNAENVTILF